MENEKNQSIPFHEKESGAFPYSEAQTAAREKFGKSIADALNKSGFLASLGAHFVLARDKGTDAQKKRWEKRGGRTMMVECAIPLPALTIPVEGGELKTKNYTILFNAVVDTPTPEKPEKETAEKPTPVVRALSYQELLAMQHKKTPTAEDASGTLQ